MPRVKTLIVEDDPTLRAFLVEVVRGLSLPCTALSRGDLAISRIEAEAFDLVISDIKLRGKSGIDILKAARARDASAHVILMTAFATVELAVEAMREGACEFLQKPFTAEVVEAAIRSVIEKLELRKDIEVLEREVSVGGLVGKSRAMNEVQSMMARVAPGNANVLIQGESGVGKELVAREIHRRSSRSGHRIVTLHLPAIPDTMVEAELFGHDRGAFTGAVKDRIGLLELADGGTVFLDEIGDLATASQAKLLRFLQERTFRRIGSNEEIEVDVRVICATHRDLAQDVAEGNFREDLYYRLNVVPIRVPPLRDRLEDLPDLISHFMKKYSQKLSSLTNVAKVSPSVMEAYRNYRWPGNVRELENVIARAIALSHGSEVTESFLEIMPRSGELGMGGIVGMEDLQSGTFSLSEHMGAIERSAIVRALELENGVKSRAAVRLGIKRTTLIEKMTKHGL